MTKGSEIMNKYILGIDGMGCGMCEILKMYLIQPDIKLPHLRKLPLLKDF